MNCYLITGQKNCLEKKGKGKDYDAHPLSKTHEPPLFPLSHHVMREVRLLGSVAGRAPSYVAGRLRAGGGVAAAGRLRTGGGVARLAGGTAAQAAWRTGDAPTRRGAHPAAAPMLLVSAHGVAPSAQVPCLRHSVPPWVIGEA